MATTTMASPIHPPQCTCPGCYCRDQPEQVDTDADNDNIVMKERAELELEDSYGRNHNPLPFRLPRRRRRRRRSTRENYVRSSSAKSRAGSTGDTGQSYLSTAAGQATQSPPSKAIWIIRTVFLLCLILVAAALAIISFLIVSRAEQDLGESQFATLAHRALDNALEMAIRRRVVVKSMAQVAASAFPDADKWPYVVIPAFETIAEDFVTTSNSIEMGFYPLVRPTNVTPGEQLAFEEFAYDYFYNQRNPPFPKGVAFKSFGRGIWSRQGLQDTTGNTSHFKNDEEWDSPYLVLFPELQTSRPGVAGTISLMMNVHSEKAVGEPIDQSIACSEERIQLQDVDIDCGVISRTQYWDRSSYLIQPIYPTNDPFNLTGVIISKFSWDDIIAQMLQDTFSSSVLKQGGLEGVTVALSTDGEHSYYYVVRSGWFQYDGKDEVFDVRLADYEESIVMNGTLLTGVANLTYSLSIYPSDDFYNMYSTGNAMVVAIGAVAIVVFMTLVFAVYDFVVRREFTAKQQLLQSKRTFMRFVSHEVRSPLNAVMMGLALLKEDVSKFLACVCSQEQHKPITEPGAVVNVAVQPVKTSQRQLSDAQCLEEWMALLVEIGQSAQGAVDVLNDLLNYDKIESNTFSMELTTFSMWDVVLETFAEFRLSAKQKGVHLEADFTAPIRERFFLKLDPECPEDTLQEDHSKPKAVVVGDRVRVTQVMRNLVSNALKFTPRGGNVTLRVGWVKPKVSGRQRSNFELHILANRDQVILERTGSVQIDVVDTGAGMTESQVSKLLRAGIQFNVNELQAGGGSGLGLYISKGIARQLKGDLKVSSMGIGLGTTFTCTLPLYVEDPPTPPETCETEGEVAGCAPGVEETCEIDYRAEESENGPLRVLVVDDVGTNRKLLSRLCQNHGHLTEESKDGREAVEMVKSLFKNNGKEFDVILMDYEMPRLRGPEAAKEIRELGCDSFIVGITGNVLPDDVNHFINCGANAVLPKPVDIGKLEDLWTEHGLLRSG